VVVSLLTDAVEIKESEDKTDIVAKSGIYASP